MTESLLCIGGPFDGQRHENSIEGSQTLVKHVAKAEKNVMPWFERAIYTRESIHFHGEDSEYFWLHESLSPRDAFRRLLDRYKGYAK